MRKSLSRAAYALLCIALIAAILFFSFLIYIRLSASPLKQMLRDVALPASVHVDLIKIDGASRRATQLDELNAIVIHYIGNPGTSAQNNRNYFNNPDSTVSAHFVVGLEGEIVQCVPLWEKSSASNHRNSDTISIEVCHPDETGVFTDATYRSLVDLVACLCRETEVDAEDVIRHYDITGKVCPKWFVEDETAWAAFKTDIANHINKE